MFSPEDRERGGNKHRSQLDPPVKAVSGDQLSSDSGQTAGKKNKPNKPGPKHEICEH
jgi:hypothetical protein